MAFEIPGVFTQANQLKSSGPVRQSHKFHRELGQHLIYFEVEVSNGFKLPSPLPFGVFAEVTNRANTHQSTLEVWVAEGYYEDKVTFHEARTNVIHVNKYICKGHTITQVVPASAFCLEGENIWESIVNPVDEVHSMRVTTYIDELNEVKFGVYNQQLGFEQTITENLVTATVAEADANFPTKIVQQSTTIWNEIKFEEIKCNWYTKTLITPRFLVRRIDLTDVNKYICKAHSINEIVPLNSFALEGLDVWESTVKPIDSSHSERVTIYIDELNTVTSGVYNKQLGIEQTVTEDLVHATLAESDAQFPSALVDASNGNWDETEFNEIKCHWYTKTLTAPRFFKRRTELKDVNKHICKAHSIKEVVLTGISSLTGPNIWESTVTPINNTHSERVTIYIDELNQTERGVYNAELGINQTITEDLVHDTLAEVDLNFPSALIEATGGNWNEVKFAEAKCNWYTKTLTTPRFFTRRTELTDVNEYICKAHSIKDVVFTVTEDPEGVTIWDTKVTPISNTHSERITTYIDEFNQTESGVYNSELGINQTITVDLVQVLAAEADSQFPSALVDATGGNWNEVKFEAINCNWYTKTITSPRFFKFRTDLTNINKYICRAHSDTEVVPKQSSSLTDSLIWETVFTPISSTHSERVTTYVDEFNQITRGEYDANLGLHQTITEDLVTSVVAEADGNFPTGTSGGAGAFGYIVFDEIKCGWFIKSNEGMNEGSSSTMYGTKNHAFPPVLQWGPNTQNLMGVNKDGETYQVSALSDSRLKEAYSGPCKVKVTKEWSSIRPLSAAQEPTKMLTDSFIYDGIFFKHSLPACLHFNIALNENTGTNHPVLKDGQYRWATYPATAHLDWPDIVLPQLPVPYKGGFLTTTETIYAP